MTDPLFTGDALRVALTQWPKCQDAIRKQFPGIDPSPQYLSMKVKVEAGFQVTDFAVVEAEDPIELRRRFRVQQRELDTLQGENAQLKLKADHLANWIRTNQDNGKRAKSSRKLTLLPLKKS